MKDEIPKDCLTPAAGAIFVAIGLVALLVALELDLRDRRLDAMAGSSMVAPRGTFSPIASAGEWVTNPDGSRVCRLSLPITRGMTFTRGLCEDWQGAIPEIGQTVPWLRGTGTLQIMIEGTWR